MTFASYYDTSYIKLQQGTWDTKGIKQNSAWKIEEIDKRISTRNKTRELVTIKISIKRRSAFYTKKLILPLIVLMSLAVTGFFIPTESGERISFSITAMLTTMVMLDNILGELPEEENEPIVLGVARVTLFMMTASLVYTCMILYVHHCDRVLRMPKWLDIILLRIIGRLVGIYPMKCKGSKEPVTLKNSSLEESPERNGRELAGTNEVEEPEDDEDGYGEKKWVMAARILDRIGGIGFAIAIIVLSVLPLIHLEKY